MPDSNSPALLATNDEPVADDRIAWRIPPGRVVPPRLIIMQTALVTPVLATLIFMFAPGEFRATWISGIFAIGLLHALWRVGTSLHYLRGPENVRLDDRGLYWLDASEQEHRLPREETKGFLIGEDEETRRGVLSLTLIFRGGEISQPVELHPPADPEHVRRFLTSRWRIIPFQKLPSPETRAVKINVEFSETSPEWYFEGSRRALHEFADVLSSIADRTSPPGVGIRPRKVILQCDWGRIAVAVSPSTWFSEGTMYIDNNRLRKLSAELLDKASQAEEEFSLEIRSDVDEPTKWFFQIVASEPNVSEMHT